MILGLIKHLLYPIVPMADKHMMVDLETLGLADDAIISSIGAVMFDPRGMDTEDTFKPKDCFYVRINPESSQMAGCTIDASTIMWWLAQSQAARDELIQGEQLPFTLAVSNFAQWIIKHKPKATRVHAKGYDFDISKLRNAFAKSNERWPFHFSDSRCTRTILELADPNNELPPIGIGVAHNALDDAKRQVLATQRAYRQLAA